MFPSCIVGLRDVTPVTLGCLKSYDIVKGRSGELKVGNFDNSERKMAIIA